MRIQPERPEGIEAGVVKPLERRKGHHRRRLEYVEDKSLQKDVAVRNPYGDGKASKKITDILFSVLQ